MVQKENKLINWIIKNIVVVLYFCFAIFVEMMAVFVVEKTPFISKPFISFGLLLIVVGIALLIRKSIIQILFLSVFLVVQAVADLGFIVVYDMTGQYFDYGMLNLRNDAFGILESIPMNFLGFYVAVSVCIFFVIFALRSLKRFKKNEYGKLQAIGYAVTIIAGISISSVAMNAENSESVDKYEKILYNEQSGNYSGYGIIGNTVNEFAKGLIFNKTEKLPCDEIDNFIYAEESVPSEEFGVSKDNNLIVVLVESFEWFAIMKNDYCKNALDLTDEQYRELFPNIYRFYDEAVVMDNYHSKEKTDISETLSILGSYPTDSYINYDYSENIMPQTLPNTLRLLTDNNIKCTSYHDGFKSFYNRGTVHKSFGFDKLVDMFEMYDMSDKLVEEGNEKSTTMHDYMTNGERNLDSEMIYTERDNMFPNDERFYTYITSITMHGIYYERDNLSEYMAKIKEVYPDFNKSDSSQMILLNYMSAVMDFDKALGIMMDDLEEKDLLDNTTIVLFSDHNSYYQQLSNYSKDIYDYDTDNYYTDLYRVPFMIYDKKVGHKVIDKFTCTADIMPTIMDLFGIKYYSNMYYGNSAFSDKESVLYSRAYGFFAGEGVIARSLKSILYKAPTVTDSYMEYFDESAKELVWKIKYCDQIFYQDYFSDDEHYEEYTNRMKEINYN